MMDAFSDRVANFLKKLFGSRNDRMLGEMLPIIERINSLEPAMMELSDVQLRVKTDEFRERYQKEESLDDLLPEAFAVVREASRRTIGLRHFDVQLIGGIVLHRGMIAEMATGEGKTLVATLAVYLNALEGKGVHVVTVNDYLARRDAQWMGPIYHALGLTVGAIQHNGAFLYDPEYLPDPGESLHNLAPASKKEAYQADVTYGTNNEFGFDYLRDNMRVSLKDQVQRGHHYAIIDEVDSILIDEARTPLIISGPSEENVEKYYVADRVAKQLKRGVDYVVKEKEHLVLLTDEGIEKAEKLVGVDSFYTGANMDWPHHIEQALRAHELFKRDRDYVTKGGEVIIVDEFTGRMMPGRRWSDGLHQAVEAKEHLRIREESQTLATITLQNYFKLYSKIAGMTGTAITEAAEFYKIYNLDVVVIPPNRPLIRHTNPDVIFLREREKFKAVVEEICQIHQTGRPILIGTTSIEKSEYLSELLKRRGIKHEVLNAKHHEREAHIVAKAGQHGAVTISTNMAGRGTDIVLGEGVAALGGLHVIGTERHEARRIDNQLRGRAGRQGDPGSSTFYVSLEDDLMRIFASDRVRNIMEKLGLRGDDAIQHPMITRAIERAQKRVEEYHFGIRKNLLDYDQVMNEQRKAVYTRRQAILRGEDLKEYVLEMIEDVIRNAVDVHMDNKLPRDQWDREGLAKWFQKKVRVPITASELEGLSPAEVAEELIERARRLYEEREQELGSEQMRKVERYLLLKKIDDKWKDHLHSMDALKSTIGLRSYGQVDPKLEYKREAFEMFSAMVNSIREEVTDLILKVKVDEEAEARDIWKASEFRKDSYGQFEAATRKEGEVKEAPQQTIRASKKVGRNAPCPCGSGKKYKKCCGAST